MKRADPLAAADLVVLSHLRYDWVWQRPQHLISRIGADRPTWFVEEPQRADVDEPTLRTLEVGPHLTRIWIDVPHGSGLDEHGHTVDVSVPILSELFQGRVLDVWLYAPTAVAIAEALKPRLLIYDVMDDLASFADAPAEMTLRMRRALSIADVAFAGGRTLHRGAASIRTGRATHLFPSGVECEHYARSRELRRPRQRKVAGYVGVLDERIDHRLLGGLARHLPDWDLQLVGPTTKIDPAQLPRADNIHHLGMQPYERLPEVMAGFDVALMPFALNAATRSISPTKTLEYLAAGLPVVSTRVPDVVADWSEVVHLADDAAGFAAACREVATHSIELRDRIAAPLTKRHEWSTIAAGMQEVMRRALTDVETGSQDAVTA